MSDQLSPTRWSEKHRQIAEAATALFLRKGYPGTSMDDVAAEASVSKQTVYKHFSDKEQLFAEIVLATTDQVEGLVRMVSTALETTTDLEADLGELARQFLTTLMRPELLRLRRLVITTADQFPEIGRSWYEQGFERALATLASTIWTAVGAGTPVHRGSSPRRTPLRRTSAMDPDQSGHVHRRREQRAERALRIRRHRN